ncbi:MAG TPA: ECF-type sigma factor [Thermoanaerobaculia bacterium]|nr:ECF-type sigma factor [Thermoanaerobaculia bacterium]
MSTHNIALLLQQYRSSDDDAFHRLVPLVYEDLRALARRQLRRHRPGRILDTTVLVHAGLELASNAIVDLRDRDHLLAVAARAMRYVVIDYLASRYDPSVRSDRMPIIGYPRCTVKAVLSSNRGRSRAL